MLVCLNGDRQVLNPTATALWDLCDGETRVDEMVWAICQLFSVDRDGAAADVAAVLDQLAALDVIDVVIQIPETTNGATNL